MWRHPLCPIINRNILYFYYDTINCELQSETHSEVIEVYMKEGYILLCKGKQKTFNLTTNWEY